MKREIHKIYDTILKMIIALYLGHFLKYIGEERGIEEVLDAHQVTLNGKSRHLDFLCRLTDGTLCHVEFEFPVAYSHDLERFYWYNITAEVRYGEFAETIVFNFTTNSKGDKKITINNTKDFYPKTFYLGDIDFEKGILVNSNFLSFCLNVSD